MGLALASAGALLYYVGSKPVVKEVAIATNEPRHPVTESMTTLTKSLGHKQLAEIDGTTTENKSIVLAPSHGKRPQFVYFVLDGCPCSFDAEPLFKKLGKKFKDEIEFVAVTNAGMKNARQWEIDQVPPYPVVSDPEQKIIKSFGATNSVFSTLVDSRGRVLKMWPGYSRDILIEMNAELAKAAGIALTPFDPEYAPVKKTSGCDFSEIAAKSAKG